MKVSKGLSYLKGKKIQEVFENSFGEVVVMFYDGSTLELLKFAYHEFGEYASDRQKTG